MGDIVIFYVVVMFLYMIYEAIKSLRLKLILNRKKKKMIKALIKDGHYAPASYSNSYLIKLRRMSSNAEYSLRACIEVTSYKAFSNYESRDKYDTVYRLQSVYFNNGGHLCFGINEEGKPVNNVLEPYKETILKDKKGDLYSVYFDNYDYLECPEFVEKAKKEALSIQKKAKDFKEKTIKDINKIVSNEENALPYFSKLFSDYRDYLNQKYEEYFKNKKLPALKAAETMKMLRQNLRTIEKEYRLLQYQLEAYEYAVPWLSDFKTPTSSEIEEIKEVFNIKSEDEEYENIKMYVSPIEYKKLSDTEKFQLALDRYKKRKKSNWEIGISFERYVGYLYESKNYKVTFFGATKGLDDLGRDIIAKNETETLIIQCKYWSQHKTIHEKHIFQLFGTMIAYCADKNKDQIQFAVPPNIKGVLITTCSLSDTAKRYAEKLNIIIKDNFEFDKNYPCVKCNISRKTGEKIYHLPFDQQYDNIQINYPEGEFYASTTKEAEENGFRRAFTWHSNS